MQADIAMCRLVIIIAMITLIPSTSLATTANATSQTPISPTITDTYGTVIDTPTTGRQVIISQNYNLAIDHEKEQPFVSILEIRNENGTTVYLAWQSGTAFEGKDINMGFLWMPEKVGTYFIRNFLISDWENPQILSLVGESAVTIVPDGTVIPYGVVMNVTQCANTWDAYITAAFAGMQQITDSDIENFYKDYFDSKYNVTVYDVQRKNWIKEAYGTEEIGVCSACTCPSGITLYLQVSFDDTYQMTSLGFKIIGPNI